MSNVRFIGLDVHQDSIVIAVAEASREAAYVYKTIPHDAARLIKQLHRLGGAKRQLLVCYEAGPTGFGLQRTLRAEGIECHVVAPSLVPVPSSRRIKTDRRDALALAHFLRSGDLTPIYVPSETTEAVRDLERAREDAKQVETAARHRLSKFLLRHGRRWEGANNWTQRHFEWIRRQKFSHPAQQRVLDDYLKHLDDYLKHVEDCAERVASLTEDLGRLVEQTDLAPLVTALQAFRGIRLVSAATIAAELGNLRRFARPTELMSFIGLVP